MKSTTIYSGMVRSVALAACAALTVGLMAPSDGWGKYRYHKVVKGNSASNSLGGSNNTAYFGGRGNDTMQAFSGGQKILLAGGKGNDAYIVNSGAFVVLAETSGKDRLTLHGFRVNGANTYGGTYLRNHLVAVDLNTVTGVVVINWTTRKGRIERTQTDDANLPYKKVLRLRKRDNWLGNLSRRKLRKNGVAVPSPRDFRNAVRYYTRIDKKVNKKFADSEGADGVWYAETPAAPTPDSRDYVIGWRGDRVGVEWGEGMLQSARFFEPNDSDAGLVSQSGTLGYLATLNDGSHAALALRPFGDDRLSVTLQYGAGTDSGLTDTDRSVQSQTLRVSVRPTDAVALHMMVGQDRETGAVLGTSSLMDMPVVNGATTQRVSAGFDAKMSGNVTVSGYVMRGVAETDLRPNPIATIDRRLSLTGYGGSVAVTDAFVESDRLVFGASRPFGITGGQSHFLLPTALGQPAESQSLAPANTPVDIEIGYQRSFGPVDVSTNVLTGLNAGPTGKETSLGAFLRLKTAF